MGNTLGLLFEINADPSQAQAALADLKASTEAGAADISSVWVQAMNAMTRSTGIALDALAGLSKAHVELADRVAELHPALLNEAKALEGDDRNRSQETYKEAEEKGRRAFENLKQKSQELRGEFILQHTALRLLADDGYGLLVPAFQAVAASLENFRNLSLDALNAFERGMASAVATSIVYEKSIGRAMEAALKSTLASLSAEALVQAIKATALGFLLLAEWDFPAAASAFESAALWGVLAGAAAGIGAAIPGGRPPLRQGYGGRASYAGERYGREETGPGASPLATGVPSGRGGVTVVFQGPFYGGRAGLDELIGHISDAVDRRDVRLSATTIKDSTLTRDSLSS